MAQIDRSTQAVVRDSGGVLVGVAQVRVGKPSMRSTVGGTGAGTAVAVGKSTTGNVAWMGTNVETVLPTEVFAANAGSMTIAISGTYTGIVDGAFIIRATSAGQTAVLDVYSPVGYKTTLSALAAGSSGGAKDLKINSADSAPALKISITGGTAGIAIGDTWIVPVYTTAAISNSQTGIICPWSLLTSSDSVGGLKSSKLGFNIGSVKKLEAGFPTQVYDQIIDGTNISLGFESLEFNNTAIQTLRSMMNQVINNGAIAAVPLEILCRTRKGDLYSYFVPSANFSKFPEISPQNDFSSTSYEFQALKQTEISPAIPTSPTQDEINYNAWLTNAPLYMEQRHTH